jgi:hypothetical protein
VIDRIVIPRGIPDVDSYVSTTTILISPFERQMIDRLTTALDTIPQTTIAALHEGYDKWFDIHETHGQRFVVRPANGAGDVVALKTFDADSVARNYAQLCEHRGEETLTLSYALKMPPMALALSQDVVDKAIRREVGYACVLALTAYQLERRGEPVGVDLGDSIGVDIGDSGFVEVPWPYIPRFFAARVEEEFARFLGAGRSDDRSADLDRVFRSGDHPDFGL